MEEIEVGEYVRTDRGIIAKVDEIRLGTNREKKIFQNIYELDNGLWTVIDYITKHSKNIIDLIEVGDYVNGYPIERMNECIKPNPIPQYKNEFNEYIDYDESEIKTIVTREQFKSIQYKLEAEE